MSSKLDHQPEISRIDLRCVFTTSDSPDHIISTCQMAGIVARV